MIDRPPRVRPDTIDECPIFRTRWLFVGHDDIDRECWFGCVSAKKARDENIEEDIDWYWTWASNARPDPAEKISPCTVTKEDPNLTKLLDQNNMETDILSRLSPDERTLRYARLLHGINRGKYNVRERFDSDRMQPVETPFLRRPPPGPRSSFTQDSDLTADRSKGKRKREGSRYDGYGDDDQETAHPRRASAKKTRRAKELVDDVEFSDASYSPGYVSTYLDDDEDDDEGFSFPDGQTVKAKDEEPLEGATDDTEGVNVDKPNPLIAERAEQLLKVLEELHEAPYAVPLRAQIDKLLHDIDEAQRGTDALDIAEVALRRGRQMLSLFIEAVRWATNGANWQERSFVDYLELHHLPEELKEANRRLTLELRGYVRIVSEKIQSVKGLRRELEQAAREDEEEL
ncbi:hypothetical protein M409DRAFT_19703 [Zasmidium cellare ATCC 36951]|uniref:Uncharacterized protein n=1 Tax=Zasmidium cellare ATCC 36951 TaxID=1080233 RepID=A0A6A6CXK6_ZASCE|nr:uncharacterized protein M409DRAFT_19703 [Zasmidium cellare ATCC 36951]KAF2170096.1 hypothetical protein M409DRAFT_19703 [Zasmidium cellare ATCC 36951]